MTWREVIYMCMDELKLSSDDATFNEDHIAFLLKYRNYLLKQQYSTVKRQIPESNYQTICLNLEETQVKTSDNCVKSQLRSKEKVPVTLMLGTTKVYPTDYYQGEITFVSRERMRYVGYNKWTSDIIYCSLGPDRYLYFYSQNPQHLYLEQVKFTAIFEDAKLAAELSCDGDNGGDNCDIMDKQFPLEESLVPQLIQLIVKELKTAEYSPEDITNNAQDDLANLIAYIRRNVKSNLQKQIEE